ncbi:methyltransferase domain-containing protein [Caldiplasma sukawensis]
MKSNFLLESWRGFPEFCLEDFQSVTEKKYSGKLSMLNSFIFTSEVEESAIREYSFLKRASYLLDIFQNEDEFSRLKIPEGKFYLRIIDPDGCHNTDYESHIGNIIGAKGRVDFKNPDFILYFYHIKKWYVGLEKLKINYEETKNRSAPKRPFFSPVSMDPKFASFLVNLGYFHKNSVLLDPFCGSGGILLEAGLKGYSVIGIDIMKSMTVGASLNLKFYGIRNYKIICNDFFKIEENLMVDGIVTDFPYGRNTVISEEPEYFFKNSAEKFHEVLSPGGRACIVSNTRNIEEHFSKYFIIDRILQQRVHRSLNRYYYRMIRKN